jgi:MFS family permease
VYLSLASRAGYGNAVLLAALAAGSISGVAFAWHERRTATPLIDLESFRHPLIATGLGSGLVSYLVLFGTLFVVPYYLAAKSIPAETVGLELSALPVAIGITAPIAGRLVNRIGEHLLTGVSMLITTGGLLEIALAHQTGGLLAGLVIAGIGLGTFIPANNATIMSNSPPGHAGVISGVLNMTRGMGTALGVAIGVALFTAGAGRSSGVAAAGHGLALALGALGALVLATGVALLLRGSGIGRGAGHRGRQGHGSDRRPVATATE